MFESERLIYRGFEDSDADSLKAALNNIEYMRNSNSQPLAPISMDRIKGLIKPRSTNELPIFAVCLKPEERNAGDAEQDSGGNLPMIGVVHFQNTKFDYKNRTCTLGFGLHEARHRGRGFGTEMMLWTLAYGFDELNLHRIELICYSHNPGAIALYRKCGFVEEGRSRQTVYSQVLIGGQMLESDWRRLQEKQI